MDTTQHQQGEDEPRAGDLLVGGPAILKFLVDLGMPEDTDIYYLRRVPVLANRKDQRRRRRSIDRQQAAAHPPRTKNHSTTKDRRCLRQPAGPAAFFRRWLLGDHDPTNLLENTSCPAWSKRGASRCPNEEVEYHAYYSIDPDRASHQHLER